MAVALSAALVIRQMESSYLAETLAAEHEKAFDLLLASSLEDLISEDQPRLETTLHAFIRRDRDLNSVKITNENGAPLFVWQRPAKSPRKHRLSIFEFPERPLRFVRNVLFEGEHFGTIEVQWDTSRTDEEVARHAYLIAFSVGAVCILFSLLVYILMDGFAIRPINRISKRVLEFREGKLDSPTPLPAFASTELHRLQDSVDALGEFLRQRKRREAELKAARDAAESANRAKTAFLSNMSHELRTPLNAINGFSEIMSMELYGALGDTRYLDHARHINFSGNHLLAIINDILDISKVEAGKADLMIEDVDLAKVIDSSMKMVRDQLEQKRLTANRNLGAQLPEIRADGRRIQQVLLNLLSNAIKFTPDGGTITVSARWNERNGIEVSVADSGIGIAEDELESVMKPFGQVESALARQHDGTGLGLTLAKALIELHGGQLRLQSELGVGTVASFTFPASLMVDRAEDAGDHHFEGQNAAIG
jgi:signal transduction histidine kinase